MSDKSNVIGLLILIYGDEFQYDTKNLLITLKINDNIPHITTCANMIGPLAQFLFFGCT